MLPHPDRCMQAAGVMHAVERRNGKTAGRSTETAATNARVSAGAGPVSAYTTAARSGLAAHRPLRSGRSVSRVPSAAAVTACAGVDAEAMLIRRGPTRCWL